MLELETSILSIDFNLKEKFCFLPQIMGLRVFLGIVDISELRAGAYFLLKNLCYSLYQSPEENMN